MKISIVSFAILLFPIKRHPEHRQEQRKREDRKRPSNLVIHRPPINQGREAIYLVGEIQLFGRTALNIIEEPIRNFGNAETQCCCDRFDNRTRNILTETLWPLCDRSQ
jgi:hypothetical protein